MKTLLDCMPYEFEQSFDDTPAYKNKDVEVVAEHCMHDDDGSRPWKRWPGIHKNVTYWVELANGKAVGWNENPSKGWSFPVVKMKKV